MKNKLNQYIRLLMFPLLVFGLLACGEYQEKTSNDDVDVVAIVEKGAIRNNEGWVGNYEGVLPCDDCEGIGTSIVLNEDMTYTKGMLPVGKDSSGIIVESGTFEWKQDLDIIMIELPDGTIDQYLVKADQIIALKDDGTEVDNSSSDKYILWRK